MKHRGFAFVTYGSMEDAQDAIDNMDMNELQGRVLKVNLARNVKLPTQGAGNRAGVYIILFESNLESEFCHSLGIGRMATEECQTIGREWW